MYKISDDQIEFILHDIEQKGISTEDVRMNLLDHICCIIEQELCDGGDFNEFYEDTLRRFYTRDLSELEEETQNLLTFKDYYAMKTTLKITGIASALMMLAGAILKFAKLPGAGISIVLGCGIFSLIFLPLMIILKFKDEDSKTDKSVLSIGIITGMIAVLGVLFKVMHWPFANILISSGLIVFLALFVPLYFLTRFKRADQRFNTIINSIMMIAGGGMLFALTTMRQSKNLTESIHTTYEYIDHQIKSTSSANSKLLSVKKGDQEFLNASNQLQQKLREAKIHFIAKTQGINKDQAAKVRFDQLSQPFHLISKTKFQDSESSNYTEEAIKTEIEKYNLLIDKSFPNHQERKINTDNLMLEQTVLYLFLQGMSQIELQVATNENSYLNSL